MAEDILNQDPFNTGNDFFDELANYQPETIKDETDFKPIKGRYIARIARLTHNTGLSLVTNELYDFYSLNIQVIETIDGDKGENRYLAKRYNNDVKGIKKLMNDLFTAGLKFDKTSRENFDLSLPALIDQSVKVRAWSWEPKEKRDGTPIPEEERISLQSFVIVADFVARGNKKETIEEVPF